MALKKQFGFWQVMTLTGILGLVILMILYGFEPPSFKAQMKAAQRALKQKHYEDAISLYLSLIEKHPQDPQVPNLLLEIGDIYNLSLNQIQRAVQTYELTSMRYPSSTYALQAMMRKAELFFNSDQHEKALKEYQSILENYPEVKEKENYRLKIGISHLKLKQYEASRREFRLILDDNLKTPLADEVLFYTANSYFLEGKPQQAIPIYESLIEHYPKSNWVIESKFNKADCHEDLGEFDQALEIYKAIQTSYPNPKVIEMQIQRNQERKLAAESRKATLEEAKKGARVNPSYRSAPLSRRRLPPELRNAGRGEVWE